MKFLFFLILSLMTLTSATAQIEFGVRDSIRRLNLSSGGYRYEYGFRVYPQKTDSGTVEKIKKDNDVYFCMIPDPSSLLGMEKTLKILEVYANLQIDDFTLGGPWKNVSDSAIFAKFKKSLPNVRLAPDDNESTCGDEDCDCPPYEFVIFSKEDTISYARSKHEGPYDFFEARLTGKKYRFNEYYPGKDIRKCKIGKLIPHSLLEELNVIRLYDSKNYYIFGVANRANYSMGLCLYLEKNIIKRIEIWGDY